MRKKWHQIPTLIAAGTMLCAVPIAEGQSTRGQEASVADQQQLGKKATVGKVSATAKARLSEVATSKNGVESKRQLLDIDIELSGEDAAGAYAIGKPTVKPITIDGKEFAPIDLFFPGGYVLMDRHLGELFAEHPKNGLCVQARFEGIPAGTNEIAKVEGTVMVLTGGEAMTLELTDLEKYPKGAIDHPLLKSAGLNISFNRKSSNGLKITLKFTGDSRAFAGMELLGEDGKAFNSSSRRSVSIGDLVTRSISTPHRMTSKAKLIIHIRKDAKEVELPFEVKGIKVRKQ